MIDALDFLPLQPVRVRANGRRDFAPGDKQQLVQTCLESKASISGMALKAGINANQLRKWIDQSGPSPAAGDCALAPFVPVQAPTPSRHSPATFSAKLPNGTLLELSGGKVDADLVETVIKALWRQR